MAERREEAMKVEAPPNVRKSILVQASPQRAFDVFTGGLAQWWPLESHHLGSQPAVTVILEPRRGGRLFERAADGSECNWGQVLAWEPPDRVIFSWEINADWEPDAGIKSEVEVQFTPEGAGTRVDLEHRGLESFGERAGQMVAIFGSSDGGWSGLLEQFARSAEAPDA